MRTVRCLVAGNGLQDADELRPLGLECLGVVLAGVHGFSFSRAAAAALVFAAFPAFRLAVSAAVVFLERPEADAGPSHVELLARLPESGLELAAFRRVCVRGHEVQRAVVLLGGNCDVAERLAVVGVGKTLQRNRVRDRSPHHRLVVPLRHAALHDGPQLRDHRTAVVRKAGDVVLDRVGVAHHRLTSGRSGSPAMLCQNEGDVCR